MQTGMYAISEMASLFNVSRQTLIYYDKIGLFKPAVVNEKGHRFYSPTQIPLMRLICMLRDLGLELDEIDRLASTFDISEMTDHLRSRVQALDEQIAGLKAERASVQERLSFYDEAVYWREREGKPELKQFERRYVVFEEFRAILSAAARCFTPRSCARFCACVRSRARAPCAAGAPCCVARRCIPTTPSPALAPLPCCRAVPRKCYRATLPSWQRLASRCCPRVHTCA